MWTDINPNHRRRDTKRDDNRVRIGVGNYSRHGKRRLSLSIGAGVMKKLGWVIGDTMTVKIDEEKRLLLVAKDKHGSVSLTPSWHRETPAVGLSVGAYLKPTMAAKYAAWIGQSHLATHEITSCGLVVHMAESQRTGPCSDASHPRTRTAAAPVPAATMPPQQLFSLEHAAKVMGVSPWTVRRMALSGEIKAVRVGVQWRIPETALRKLYVD